MSIFIRILNINNFNVLSLSVINFTHTLIELNVLCIMSNYCVLNEIIRILKVQIGDPKNLISKRTTKHLQK